ncbi:hypothetical protein GPECTOR_13g791 [Gonium pectorale]|uniref:Uncharacterized protein n=1 Tax=Gonium pectorale TaxID=33097 RepID=A0A150GNC7_GONPE|nr:hypothetical protein GPECTOR_13g791 [Gonium pectorale]|eukprot:KXZ51304.1 hypothetical protein GPECTOR_13g791 [Gonium pectorale]
MADQSSSGPTAQVVLAVRVPAVRSASSLRCVVSGPLLCLSRLRQHAYLDEVFDPCFVPNTSDQCGAEGFAVLRFALPSAALRNPGALVLHVLPPSMGLADAAATPAIDVASISRAAEEHLQQQQQLPEASAATAPLASLPLLVLPSAAAQEVRRLHEEVLGAEAVACLDGLLSRQAGGGGQERQALLLAAAGTDMITSGLHDVAYDMGCLLSMPPYSMNMPAGAEAATKGYPTAPPQQPRVDLRLFDGLLRLLASCHMAACLEEALRARGACGGECPLELVTYAFGGGADYDSTATEAGGGVLPPNLEAEVFDGGTRVGSTGASASSSPKASSAGEGSCQKRMSTRKDVAAEIYDTSSGPGGSQTAASLPGSDPLASLPPPGPAWWLRALLRGFQPPALEAAYQAFKAAQLVYFDFMALLLLAAIRTSPMYRTYESDLELLGSMAAAGTTEPAAPAPRWLQIASQGLFLAVIMLVLGLTLLTPLHRT